MKRTLGEFGGAFELILEGLDLFRTLGHKLGIAEAFEGLGAVSAVQGDGPKVIARNVGMALVFGLIKQPLFKTA